MAPPQPHPQPLTPDQPAPRAAPPVGIARRAGLAFAVRLADPPRPVYPEHLAIAGIWLGSVALALWRMGAFG